ncbi:hypothetical protein Pan54_28960 [Rubinisphaera italica]|uniref:Uncharacterized protein n=1 Tax=Rubinisphaera italica TaxID=2527969 RepID=A0A5C5XJ26_9PLAN|nr:hypothetical protein Pan54_28960 [Rubinisphaera italica]
MTYNLPLDRGCLSGVDIVFTETHSESNQVKYADFSDFAMLMETERDCMSTL